MCCSEDASAAQLQNSLLTQVIAVFCIEHAIGKCLARTDTEEVAGKTGTVAVDVVKCWSPEVLRLRTWCPMNCVSAILVSPY